MTWLAIVLCLYYSLLSEAHPPSPEPQEMSGIIVMDVATFGAGCYWGVEKMFRDAFPLIKHTKVGFMGGKTEKPTYEQVSEGTTGHAEVVQLVYDPGQISYKELVEFFFRLHDPTQEDGQGNDKGSQYRSVIFYSKKSQAKIAKEVLAQVQEEHFKEKPIVTKIVKESEFWPALEYHQKYLERNPAGYNCHKLHW